MIEEFIEYIEFEVVAGRSIINLYLNSDSSKYFILIICTNMFPKKNNGGIFKVLYLGGMICLR